MSAYHKPRRGAALLAAIGVLAVLTILVSGLAASQSEVRSASLRLQLKQELQNAARACVDEALARMSAESAEFAGDIEIEIQATTSGGRGYKAIANYRAQPIAPDAPPYVRSNFLSHRPGDFMVEVTVRGRRGRHVWRMHEEYLLNAAPETSRRVRLSQRLAEGLRESAR